MKEKLDKEIIEKNDLNKCIAIAKEYCDKENINYNENVKFEMFERDAAKNHATCFNKKLIKIRPHMLLATEHELVTILIHEILHTVPGINGHDTGWKSLARKFDKHGFDIQRCMTIVLEVEDETVKKVKYILRCKNCGNEYKYFRKNKFVNNYKKCYCRSCGRSNGKFERIVL